MPLPNDWAERLEKHRLWLIGRDGGWQLDLSGADLSRSDLWAADLSAACLASANLSDAYLLRANLSGANLSRACLSNANLSMANLSGADLRWAGLSRADLSQSDLSLANLKGTILDPKLPANGAVVPFNRWADDPRFVVGYRTRQQIHIGGEPWPDGHHVAPVFSACPITSCHPGIYLCPVRERGHDVEVRALATDVHQAGVDNDIKWRCRECDIAPLGTWQVAPAEQVVLMVKRPTPTGEQKG